jgi:phytoene dehydrogenase-like protein
VKGGRACGVVLESGDEILAPAVLTSADPVVSFLKLVDPRHLPDDFLQDIRRYRTRGSSGKVNLALSGLPEFSAMPGPGPLHRGAVSISPSIDYIERAYDEAKYGGFSLRPYIDCIFPSVIDPDMAPPGKHVMSCFVQYAPSDIQGGWDDARREAFGDAVVETLCQYAPNLKQLTIGRQVLTPLDIERITGITGGNIFHGELLLHQLFFFRPSARWSRFRTPLPGYYLAGAGAHPGGGILGAPGMLAARAVLKDGRR